MHDNRLERLRTSYENLVRASQAIMQDVSELQRRKESKLQEERQKMERKLQHMEEKYDHDIRDMERKMKQIQRQLADAERDIERRREEVERERKAAAVNQRTQSSGENQPDKGA